MTRSRIYKYCAQCLVLLAFGIFWHVLVVSNIVHRSFLPSPLDVFQAISELVLDGTLGEHIRASLLRVFLGYLCGSVLGVCIGLTFGWYTFLKEAFKPLMEIARTISPIAWIPLAIMWFGIGDTPAMFIIAVASFFPVFVASVNAPKNVNPLLVRVAINFGASGRDLLIKVLLPASLPFIFVGLRIGLGVAWLVIVAAEMVGMRSGLGYLILDARNTLRTEVVIACMFVIGGIGFVLDQVMEIIERRMIIK